MPRHGHDAGAARKRCGRACFITSSF
jgi:hypothetical protein